MPLRDAAAAVLHGLVGGLRSGMSYSDARTIPEFHAQRPLRADHARGPAREPPARRVLLVSPDEERPVATTLASPGARITTVRTLAIDAVQKANSGHPGAPMGLAPVGWTLFTKHLRHDPSDPAWPDRDRFVLSAGHASMLLYALLHLTGYDLPMDELKRFRQLGSETPGHPERGDTPGVEITTGPLGQGFANAVGLALAERMLAARFNRPDGDIVGPPDVVHLLRRRPDGGHLPRGRLDRRVPRARAPHRDLRRQPHQPRRADEPLVRRRRPRRASRPTAGASCAWRTGTTSRRSTRR